MLSEHLHKIFLQEQIKKRSSEGIKKVPPTITKELYSSIRKINRIPYLKGVRHRLGSLKKEIIACLADARSTSLDLWDVNYRGQNKLLLQVDSLVELFVAEIQFYLDIEAIPELVQREFGRKLFFSSRFVQVYVRPLTNAQVSRIRRTMLQFGRPTGKLTVSKKRTLVEIWLNTIEATLKTDLGGIVKRSFSGEWSKAHLNKSIRKYFLQKVDLWIGKFRLHRQIKRTDMGVLDDILWHMGQLAWTQPLPLVNKALREDLTIGFDTVTKYRDLVLWSTALDERTCPQCGILDGRVWPEHLAPTCPLHPLCRCVKLPYFEGQMGSYDRGENWSTWLDRQDDETQSKILGQRKFFLKRLGVDVERLAKKSFGRLAQDLIHSGYFIPDDMELISKLVQERGVFKALQTKNLRRQRSLESLLKKTRSPTLRKTLKAEILRLEKIYVARDVEFAKTLKGLEREIAKIHPVKILGKVPTSEELIKCGFTQDQYRTEFKALQVEYKKLLKKALAQKTPSTKMDALKEAEAKLRTFFKKGSQAVRGITSRDYIIFQNALRDKQGYWATKAKSSVILPIVKKKEEK